MKIRFSEDEYADVAEVSERLGMRPGAWAGEVAVRYARGQLKPVPADMRDAVGEIVRQRPYLTSLGSLLNQIARVANAQGELPADAARQLQVVQRQFEQLRREHDELEMDAVRRTQESRL